MWFVSRLTLAVLLAAQGWMRFLGGGVVPFGDWLNSQGFSFGLYLAAITGYAILATVFYAAGKWLWQLSLGFVLIYSCGLVLLHAPFGWFVVGAQWHGIQCVADCDFKLYWLSWLSVCQTAALFVLAWLFFDSQHRAGALDANHLSV